MAEYVSDPYPVRTTIPVALRGFDVGVTGANGITLSAGLTIPTPDEIPLKRAILSNATNAFVMADGTKWSARAFPTISAIASMQNSNGAYPNTPELLSNNRSGATVTPSSCRRPDDTVPRASGPRRHVMNTLRFLV